MINNILNGGGNSVGGNLGFSSLLGGVLGGDQDGNGMVDEVAGVAAGAAVTYFSGGTLSFLAPFAGDFVNGLVDGFLS